MSNPLQLSQTWTSVYGGASATFALQPDQVIKVRKGQEAEALKATRFNGADDLAFSYQGDLYIASGRELKDLRRVRKDQRAHAVNGQPVQIVRRDDEITRPLEGGSQTWSNMLGPGSIEVPFAAVGAALGTLYGAVKSVLPNKQQALTGFGEPVKDGPFAR